MMFFCPCLPGETNSISGIESLELPGEKKSVAKLVDGRKAADKSMILPLPGQETEDFCEYLRVRGGLAAVPGEAENAAIVSLRNQIAGECDRRDLDLRGRRRGVGTLQLASAKVSAG